MNESPNEPSIDAFLDGRAGAAERRDIVDRLSSDESLRREVELARRIDEALVRLHGPTTGRRSGSGAETSAVEARSDHVEEPVRRPRRGWRLAAIGAGAVALALVVTGTALVAAPGWRLARDRARIAAAPTTPAEVYRAMVRRGFSFEWSCADDAEFIDYTRSQFGQAFIVAQTPGLEVLGWAYPSAVLGSPTGVLLARRDGVPSVLLVVPREAERPQATGRVEDLTVARRVLGGLVLYEVSPQPDSDLLALVVSAEPTARTADGP